MYYIQYTHPNFLHGRNKMAEIESPFFRVIEEKADPPKPERPQEEKSNFKIEEVGVETITFRGQALEDIQKLQGRLRKADKPSDVVRTALEILALALDREIIIEGGGKKWRISDLWNHQ
jgi:hypothetical protein